MPIYSIDLRVYATAYIRADNKQAAREVAESLAGQAIVLIDQGATSEHSEVEITGADYSDYSTLGEGATLSPCMTIHGIDDGAIMEEVDA